MTERDFYIFPKDISIKVAAKNKEEAFKRLKKKFGGGIWLKKIKKHDVYMATSKCFKKEE